MPARKATELTDLIKKLRTIRRQHEVALAEIETTFRSFGIEHLLDSPGSRKRGAAAATKGKAKAIAKAVAKAASAPSKGKGKSKGKAKSAAKSVAKGKKARVVQSKKVSKAAGKAAGKAAERRARAKYTQTGDEFILSFLSKKGNATTNEIRQHWKKQGRRGKAENNLTGLVKSGKVLRSPTPGQAGSTYSLPTSATPAS